MSPIVLIDACVLHSAFLRDLLMRLALEDLFQARWTERIHDEWMRSVEKRLPDIPRPKLEKTRRLMEENIPESLVVDYEHGIEGLDLPDVEDRHVLAAAIQCRARFILTFNLKDFPDAVVVPHGVEAVHPDAFLNGLLARRRGDVLAAMREHRASLKKPTKRVEEYLDSLHKCGLVETASRLRASGDGGAL